MPPPDIPLFFPPDLDRHSVSIYSFVFFLPGAATPTSDCVSRIMTNATTNISFTKIVNLSRGGHDLKKLMSSLSEHGIARHSQQLIPTIVDLSFMSKVTDQNIGVVRKLFKELRPFQLSHYMRFVSQFNILMESDCADIFYTRDGRDHAHRDVTFYIHPLSHTHVEVRVKVHPLTKTHLNVRELSRMTHKQVFNVQRHMEESAINKAMINFHRNTRFGEISATSTEDMHVLFIPYGDHGGCHLIPLFGLSPEDAIRRSKYADRTFASLQTPHGGFIPEDMARQEIVHILVSELVDNQENGPRSSTAAQTYALAEILYGYYLRTCSATHRKPLVSNNFVWFDEIQDVDNRFVETYAMHITHM